MTTRELKRKKLHEAWTKAEAECEVSKAKAKAATGADRDFWMSCFKADKEKADELFFEYMNA